MLSTFEDLSSNSEAVARREPVRMSERVAPGTAERFSELID